MAFLYMMITILFIPETSFFFLSIDVYRMQHQPLAVFLFFLFLILFCVEIFITTNLLECIVQRIKFAKLISLKDLPKNPSTSFIKNISITLDEPRVARTFVLSDFRVG